MSNESERREAKVLVTIRWSDQTSNLNPEMARELVAGQIRDYFEPDPEFGYAEVELLDEKVGERWAVRTTVPHSDGYQMVFEWGSQEQAEEMLPFYARQSGEVVARDVYYGPWTPVGNEEVGDDSGCTCPLGEEGAHFVGCPEAVGR